MAGLPGWFQSSDETRIVIRRSPFGIVLAPAIAAPIRPRKVQSGYSRSYDDLEYGRMELATLCPVDCRTRCCLEHLQEGLGIFHGAHAVEDYDTFIATTNGQGSISFTSSTSRTCPLPSNVVPA